MIEYLSKTRFINALVREHLAMDSERQDPDASPRKQYLRLEVIHPSKTGEHASLVIRGNRLGEHWMVLETGSPGTPDGMVRLHKLAVDIGFAAARRISEQLGGARVEIGMPPVEG